MATAAVQHYHVLPTQQLAFHGDLKSISPTIVEIEALLETNSSDELGANNFTQASRGNDETLVEETRPLISASLITEDFDALRFDAAASLQVLRPDVSLPSSIPRSHHLISSPYNDVEHLLDLRTLDTQCRLLSQALTFLKPIRQDYSIADYRASFNWQEVLSVLRTLATAEGHKWTSQSFYTVIFRSQLNTGIDLQRLHDLDKTSHREAVISGQLLKYWFGRKNEHERNLATCIWRSKEDARLGGLGPDHKKARLAARELYHEIKFSTWSLVIEDGAESLRLEEANDNHHQHHHHHR